jgi:hypothetical protein
MSDPNATLSRLVRWIMRDTLFHGTYSSVVQLQHDDDSLDLLPDDARVRGTGLAHVGIRHGVPGIRVRVPIGARVILGFENGDPRRPYAALWDPGSIESLEFDGGQANIARVGDHVVIFWPPTVPITGAGTLGLVPFTLTGATLTIATPGTGIIDTGAPRAKA